MSSANRRLLTSLPHSCSPASSCSPMPVSLLPAVPDWIGLELIYSPASFRLLSWTTLSVHGVVAQLFQTYRIIVLLISLISILDKPDKYFWARYCQGFVNEWNWTELMSFSCTLCILKHCQSQILSYGLLKVGEINWSSKVCCIPGTLSNFAWWRISGQLYLVSIWNLPAPQRVLFQHNSSCVLVVPL